MGKIAEYIKKEMNKGYSLDRIKKALLEAGHDIQLIEEEIEKEGIKEEKNIAKDINKTLDWIKNQKTAKITTIIAISLILLTLGLLFTKQLMQPGETQQPGQTLTEKQIQNQLTNCETKINLTEKNICLLKLAAEQDSTQFCDRISTETNDLVYYACVDKYWERADCIYENIIGEDSDLCYFNKINNSQITKISIGDCYRINNESLQQACEGIITEKEKAVIQSNSYWLCQTYSCKETIAVNTGNCSLLGNKSIESYNDCLLKLAKVRKDSSVCESITDKKSWTYRECLFSFYSENDFLETQKLLLGENDTADYILAIAAIDFGYPNLCDHITQPEFGGIDFYRQSCKLFSIILHNLSCDTIRDSSLNSICKRINLNDKSFCSNLEGDFKKYCNSDLPSNCISYNDENVRFICEKT